MSGYIVDLTAAIKTIRKTTGQIIGSIPSVIRKDGGMVWMKHSRASRTVPIGTRKTRKKTKTSELGLRLIDINKDIESTGVCWTDENIRGLSRVKFDLCNGYEPCEELYV